MPRRGKRSWPGPRPRRAVSKGSQFRRQRWGFLLTCPVPGGEFLSQRWERNQRIAGGRLRMSADALIFALPPVPHYEGRSPERGKTLPARKIRSAWVRFLPGPQGPWGVKNFNCCGSTTAPEFAEPTLPVQIAFPLQGGRPIPPVRGKWPKAKRGRGARRSRDG